jgi:hypothetical protein
MLGRLPRKPWRFKLSVLNVRAERPHRFWTFRSLRALAIALSLSTISACGSSDGLNRQAVTGTVTWEGQALSTGAILFEPATNESGTTVGSTIKNGKFSIARDQGPVPGDYVVRIYSSSGTQAAPIDGQSERSPRPMLERLPATYNAKSELRAQVTARRPNRFQFELRARE